MIACKHCGKAISESRLQAFAELGEPEPDTCIEHADIGKRKSFGRMVYDHKTAGELIIVDGGDPNFDEQKRRLELAFTGRSGRGSSG